jgi:metal-responsive CopG/Arc/MetJ family transcriptional regulator
MRQVTLRAPDELVEAIDRRRAQEAADTGEVQSRSEWMREAAREKLGIEGPNNNDESPEKGAA